MVPKLSARRVLDKNTPPYTYLSRLSGPKLAKYSVLSANITAASTNWAKIIDMEWGVALLQETRQGPRGAAPPARRPRT